jgi:membrane protein
MSILITTIKGWYQHRIQLLAAAFTFYALLSLGPLLVISLTVASHILDTSTARDQTIQQLSSYVGQNSAMAIGKMIDGASNARHKLMATTVGLILLFVGSSSVFSSLHEALNIIWEVPAGKRNGILTFVRKQSITVILVILIVTLFLLSLITSTILAMIGKAVYGIVNIPLSILNISDFTISVIVFYFLFSFVFKIVPDVPIKWKEVRLGALVTSLLFNSGKFFISRTLAHSGIFIAYGSLASFVLIIVWVYLSTQIVLLGAEFTRAHILQTQYRRKKTVRQHNRNIIVR